MSRRLRFAGQELELLERHDAVPATSEVVRFHDRQAAEAFVRGLFEERPCREQLQALVARIDPVGCSLRDHRGQLALAASLLATDTLRVARPVKSHAWGGSGAKTDPAAERPPAAEPRQDVWLELRVVDDDTGKPVPDVKLTVTLPDDAEHERSTDGEGVVDFPSTVRGSATVLSELASAGLEQTFDFVGMGEPPPPADDEDESDEVPPGPYRIAHVEQRRVRSGETLESVAEAAGMSWQELAEFNWSTSSPGEVNKHLRFELGCTKKDASGANYRFDDLDRPGILYVPRSFRRGGLATERAHTLRVRRIRRVLAIRLDDPFLGFLGETAVAARYADGSASQLKTDEHGVVEVETDHWSDDGNFVDLQCTTDLREQQMRVFLVLEHAQTRVGAWQRLVNLGYVAIDEPTCEPDSDDLFAAALEEFQADRGIPPTGELDPHTQAALESWHRSASPWGEHGRAEMEDPDDADTRSKEEVA